MYPTPKIRTLKSVESEPSFWEDESCTFETDKIRKRIDTRCSVSLTSGYLFSNARNNFNSIKDAQQALPREVLQLTRTETASDSKE